MDFLRPEALAAAASPCASPRLQRLDVLLGGRGHDPSAVVPQLRALQRALEARAGAAAARAATPLASLSLALPLSCVRGLFVPWGSEEHWFGAGAVSRSFTCSTPDVPAL